MTKMRATWAVISLATTLATLPGCSERSPDPAPPNAPLVSSPEEPLVSPSVPEAEPQPPELTEREVALRILNLGGSVGVLKDGQRVNVKSSDELPEGDLFVTASRMDKDEFNSKDIAKIATLQRLGKLAIAFKGLSDGDLATIATVDTLTRVHIGRYYTALPDITDQGIAHVASLPDLSEVLLQSLPNVSGEGIQNLAQCGSLATLRLFSMGHLSGDDLSALQQCPKLKFVQLQGEKPETSLSDKIRVLANIDTLSFYYCRFDDDAISELSVLPNVKRLELHFCHLTESQENFLRERKPEVKFWVHAPEPAREDPQ